MSSGIFRSVLFLCVRLFSLGPFGREPLCPPLGFALEYLGVGSPTSPRRPLYPGTWRRSIVAAACSSGQRCLAHCPPNPCTGALAYTRSTRVPRLGQSVPLSLGPYRPSRDRERVALRGPDWPAAPHWNCLSLGAYLSYLCTWCFMKLWDVDCP